VSGLVKDVLDPHHWRPKLGEEFPCHYGEKYLDWYADRIRKSAVKSIWPRDVLPPRGCRVMDVGCGDGRFGEWLRREFGVHVSGIDPFNWPGAVARLNSFEVRSIVGPRKGFAEGRYDLAICVTSLPFMTDWAKALHNLYQIADRLLVVENLQTPTPSWQTGLPEKRPISYPDLVLEAKRVGWAIEAERCINLIDRRWLDAVGAIPILRPVVAVATFVVDWVVGRCLHPVDGRYSAVLFRKVA